MTLVNANNYALFLFLLIAAFCFFFLLTLGFSYCSCFLRSPIMPSFWHFLLNLLIALSTFSVSPTLTVDNFFTHFCSKFYINYILILLFVKYFVRIYIKFLYKGNFTSTFLIYYKFFQSQNLPCQIQATL